MNILYEIYEHGSFRGTPYDLGNLNMFFFAASLDLTAEVHFSNRDPLAQRLGPLGPDETPGTPGRPCATTLTSAHA